MSDNLELAIQYFEERSPFPVRAIHPLEGGTANDLFLINWAYVVRIKKKDSVDERFDPISKEMLIHNTLLSRHCHFLPTTYDFDSKTGNMISEYQGSTKNLSSLGDDDQIAFACCQIVDALAKLHQIGGPFPYFDADSRFHHYREITLSGDCYHFPNDFEEALTNEAKRILSADEERLCHNDLVSGNIILTGEEKNPVRFIDFEFAAINAVKFDLASLISENNLSSYVAEVLLQRYYGSRYNKEIKEDVRVICSFEDLLWFYWAEARFLETKEEIFASIAKQKKEKLDVILALYQKNPKNFEKVLREYPFN